MRILISSHFFAPSVGGIELVSGIVADEFNRLGHEVRVVTQTPDPERRSKSPFPVIRQPGRSELWRQIRWCDVYLQSNISLPTLWPAFLVRKPVLVVHHTWISRVDGRIGWQDRLKLFATRWVRRNLAVSKALAATIPAKCGVIANPYREDVFTAEPGAQRDRDLVFVGRLVSDKGCSILLEALTRLAADAIRPALTVVGSGPELENLKAQAMSSGLAGQVVFAGQKTGPELAALLNRHRILVVPSLWQEPFGIVALEGIACGCVVIGSAGGGLPDAIGPCGETFPNGDHRALAERLRALLADPVGLASYRVAAPGHLAKHTRAAVAEAYVRELDAIRPPVR